jgi:glycosyltransferase involved in cell wall biosynthesis
MLSIVIIGRNEGENLRRLAASLQELRAVCEFPVETLFIDSASSDDSVDQAQLLFDRVIELQDSPQICASAGRYVGTIEARYPWILYLDGDMELCREFFPILQNVETTEADCLGYVGIYVHRFSNGMVAWQGFAGGRGESEWAAYFGGAALLRRQMVLAVGNWNPAVFGKEELELYARLGNGKRLVRYVHLPMVYHYFEYHTRLELLRRLLYPGGGQGKVFYGYGQSIRALFVARKLLALVRLDYEPYIFWALIIFGLIALMLLPLQWGLIVFVAIFVSLTVWMRSGVVIRYLTMPISFFLGWPQYFSDYRPLLRKWIDASE